MPKKQRKKNKLKVSRKALLVIAGLLMLMTISGGIYWQVQINKSTSQQLDWLNARQFGGLIEDSMQRLNNLKTELPASGRITELRLALPDVSDEFGKVLYRYSEASEDLPAEIEITNFSLIDLGFNKLRGLTTEDIMNGHSEASACSRGFKITLSPVPNSEPHKTKLLADGRTLYLFREHKCGQGGVSKTQGANSYSDADMRFEAMDEFEDYLLKARSY